MVCDDFHNSLRDELGDYTMCLVMASDVCGAYYVPYETVKELRHSVLDTESMPCLGLMASKTVDPESSSG
jgi:hypothetical protein